MFNFIKCVVFSCLSYVFCKNSLHMFQQQRYEPYRYTKWLFNKNNIHFSYTFIYSGIVILLYTLIDNKIVDLLCLAISIVFAIYFISDEAKKEYIKDLVLTARVKRQIICLSLLLALCIYLTLGLDLCITGIMVIYIPYLLIYPMYILTYPIEESIKKYYENQARRKLDSLTSLKKIGITGSFGKTSTKNIVNDIISQNFLTLITPASYNTPMGITRTIRGELKPIHEIFVCEMGADKINDISYLMDFVKPQYGVVTSVGPQHLSTFKSMENIINEKMKEIEMLPKDGVGFINLDNEYISKYKIKNSCKVVSVGIRNSKANYVAKNIKYSKDGSTFSIKIKNRVYKFKTSLLGEHNITNILIGIAIGIELGMNIKDIAKNVSQVRQVEHRLEVKHINNFTFIDDAFNANPVGSKMALDVLKLMPGKRVIVTPGMIDLGAKQQEINKEFGMYMKNKADYVLLVGEKQTKSIYNGLVESKFDMKNVIVFKTVKQAFDYVYSNFSSKDTILLENDLPDAFSV